MPRKFATLFIGQQEATRRNLLRVMNGQEIVEVGDGWRERAREQEWMERADGD